MTLLQPTRPPAREDADVTTVRTHPRWVVPAATTSGSRSASAAGSTSGSATSPTKVTGTREISVSQGVAKLRAAGIAPYGQAQLAMSWTDRNGENVVLTSRKDAATTDGNGTTWRTANLRIAHVAHLDSKPVVLRTMNDPSGEPCEFDLTNDVAGDYAIAGDLNGDGYGELSVSWSSSCLSEADRSVAEPAAGRWPTGFHLETQRVWLRLFH